MAELAMPARDILARFWSKVDVRSADECWEWRQLDPDVEPTYGRFRILPGFRAIGAHRFSWVLANRRDIPNGRLVMHSCDNKRCVNPAHLSLGTVADNTRDATAKGLNDPSKAWKARSRRCAERRAA